MIILEFGALAQLARAPALQAGGQEFESLMLHQDCLIRRFGRFLLIGMHSVKKATTSSWLFDGGAKVYHDNQKCALKTSFKFLQAFNNFATLFCRLFAVQPVAIDVGIEFVQAFGDTVSNLVGVGLFLGINGSFAMPCACH